MSEQQQTEALAACACGHLVMDHFGGCEFCPCRFTHEMALNVHVERIVAARLAAVEARIVELHPEMLGWCQGCAHESYPCRTLLAFAELADDPSEPVVVMTVTERDALAARLAAVEGSGRERAIDLLHNYMTPHHELGMDRLEDGGCRACTLIYDACCRAQSEVRAVVAADPSEAGKPPLPPDYGYVAADGDWYATGEGPATHAYPDRSTT